MVQEQILVGHPLKSQQIPILSPAAYNEVSVIQVVLEPF